MTATAGRAALDAAAALGPFAATAPTPVAGQATVAALLADPSPFLQRVDAALPALGAGASRRERRAAASVVQLGLVARLVAPPLAAAVVAGAVPALSPDRVWWSLDAPQPIPLAIDASQVAQTDRPDDVAAAFEAVVLRPVVAPLLEVVADAARVSGVVLWGNVWSAVAGFAAAARATSPTHAARAGDVARAVIAGPAERHTPGPRIAGSFAATGSYRRATCCLLYALPRRGLCGDCVLAVRG